MNAPTITTLAMPRPAARPLPTLSDSEPQAPREEFANSASHVVGVVMACAALPTLASSVAPGRTALLVGVWVFALTMLVVYLASSLFHAMPAGRTRALPRRADHAAIYVFIAGSFTPFAMAAEPSPDRVLLLAGIWLLALLGAGIKLRNGLRHRRVSTLAYLSFGWMVLAVAQPLLQELGGTVLGLLALGAVLYSVGCVFFVLDRRLPFAHLAWHLLVLAGSACHVMAVRHLCN